MSFVSGDIVVEVPRKSSLEFDISTISGDIDHDAMSRETLMATSVSGEVRILSPFEELNAKSVSGSIL